MNVSMTPELEAYVHAQVESGMYQSASELFREAIRLLAHRNELRQQKIEQLNKDIQIGLDQAARGEFLTAEQSKQDMMEFKQRFLSARDKNI